MDNERLILFHNTNLNYLQHQKIATRFFRNDKVKQEYFSYNKALRNLTTTAKKEADTPAT